MGFDFLTSHCAYPDSFSLPQGKQYGMPPRQISPQSFDDILSDLGDDPAIPDPHGIRKPSAPPRPQQEFAKNTKSTAFCLEHLPLKDFKISPFFLYACAFLALSAGLFLILESNKSSSAAELEPLQIQLSSLQKQFDLAKIEQEHDLEGLYEEIDLLEVSIHLLEEKAPLLSAQNKTLPIPHEADLRRWKYLGLIRVKGFEQAFFHNGKVSVMLAKDGLALGDWRLSQAQKEGAVLTHPKGKSITFQSSKPE